MNKSLVVSLISALLLAAPLPVWSQESESGGMIYGANPQAFFDSGVVIDTQQMDAAAAKEWKYADLDAPPAPKPKQAKASSKKGFGPLSLVKGIGSKTKQALSKTADAIGYPFVDRDDGSPDKDAI